jgi:hypothetical protein
MKNEFRLGVLKIHYSEYLLAFPDRLVFAGIFPPLSSFLPACLCCYLFSYKKMQYILISPLCLSEVAIVNSTINKCLLF